ncbi:DNA-binding domain-containing protein [Pontibacterium granulatum]|uniref:DNA-binding domain-containing protein n=1 Tax=Pontibacterium granulatum TaxID=2036029 RepID=UPI00249ACA31|nr:DNA-binding domain-containing protein [Pontibacterium granulatum]MDI3326505.1 DNA-binding domain-containing protein [Pontibacterium granulatum]
MTLRDRQQQLLAYMMGQESGIAEHICDHGKISVEHRLHIYRNAYQVRFWEVIDTDHPVLGTYLGDELFNNMVRDYIHAYPSHFRSLRQFADQLPRFLTEDETLSAYPHIAELARFERELLNAFDAADTERVERQDLVDLLPEKWPGLKLVFHPSLIVFTTTYNVVDIWQHIKAERAPPEPLQQDETWLIWRNRERLTEFSSMDNFEFTMFMAFRDGSTLEQVAELLLEISHSDPSQHMVETLFAWLDRGWITQLDIGLHAIK